MVHYAPLIGAVAVASSLVAAVPMPYDSSSSSSYDNSYDSSSSYDNSYSSSSYDNSYSSSSDYSSSSSYYNQYSTSSSYYNQYSTTTTEAATAVSTSSYYNQYSSSYDTTSTYSSYSSYSTPSYGSGSSYWGGSDYEGCVQQCIAEFGNGMSSISNSDNYGTTTTGSYGTGATHTVIVAPSQGVLRYVPFYTNANVGDTIQFVWHANEHTVTKSSQLELCNKTSEAPVFASGEHNASFVFNQVVNDTNPIFFYCGTPEHCEKGMFGMINANSTSGSGSVSSMMPSMLSSDSTLSAMYAYQMNVSSSSNNTYADNWGSDIDMSSMPSWSQSYVAQNVLYTRTFLRANPEVINPDGSISLGNAQSLMIPGDVGNTLAAAGVAGSSAQGAAATSSASSTSSSAAATATHSGAGSITVPRLAAAIVAVAVTFFAL